MSTQAAIQELQNTIKALELIQEVNDLPKAKYLGDYQDLTQDEVEVLKYTCDGFVAKEIAGILFKSVRTIESYRNDLMAKLGAWTLAHAVHIAYQRKIIE